MDSNHLNGIILIAAFLLAAGVTFASNWLALIPWRRSRDKHWTEQARLLYPVRTAAKLNLIAVPGSLMLGALLLGQDISLLWGFVGLVSFLGANVGNLFLQHEVFPRTTLPDSLRQTGMGFLVQWLTIGMIVTAILFMPGRTRADPDLIGLIAAILVVFGIIGWIMRGWVWLARIIGLFQPAPQRLSQIARDTAARMGIDYRKIFVMRSAMSGAFAFPGPRFVLFTTRLLELLPDEEIAAICAHELAHLSESRGARFSRSLSIMAFLPLIFLNPLGTRLSSWALLVFGAIIILPLQISARTSRRLESRADSLAKANEGEAGTYARALTKICEDNLVPAIIAKKHSHPDLYDRLLAAGVTPDFPKPVPARTIGWNWLFFLALAGVLVVGTFVRLVLFILP